MHSKKSNQIHLSVVPQRCGEAFRKQLAAVALTIDYVTDSSSSLFGCRSGDPHFVIARTIIFVRIIRLNKSISKVKRRQKMIACPGHAREMNIVWRKTRYIDDRFLHNNWKIYRCQSSRSVSHFQHLKTIAIGANRRNKNGGWAWPSDRW